MAISYMYSHMKSSGLFFYKTTEPPISLLHVAINSINISFHCHFILPLFVHCTAYTTKWFHQDCFAYLSHTFDKHSETESNVRKAS